MSSTLSCSHTSHWMSRGGGFSSVKDAERFPQKVELGCNTTGQVLKTLEETVDPRKLHQAKFRKHTGGSGFAPGSLPTSLVSVLPWRDTVFFEIEVPSSCVSTNVNFLVSPILHGDPIV